VVRRLPYCTYQCDVFDYQPRLSVSLTTVSAPQCLDRRLRFLDNVTTDIIHYEEKKVCAYVLAPLLANQYGDSAFILPRKSLEVR